MFTFISNFLLDILKSSLEYLMDNITNKILDIALDPVSSMNGLNINSIKNYILTIGVSYCSLKFAKKLFDIYILWTDGDNDNPIHILVINYIKSIALILSFDYLYLIFIEIIKDIGDKLVSSISSKPTQLNINRINVCNKRH